MKEGSLYEAANATLVHHVNQALRAHKLFQSDKEYIVRNDEVVIVDEFTGRMMPGRRYSEGLHQALEAKEGVTVQPENVTLASITFQNYFRLYKKLAGMTGTAATEADEFAEIYKLTVVEIPTHRPVSRTGRGRRGLSQRRREAEGGGARDRRGERQAAADAGRHDLDRKVGATWATCSSGAATRRSTSPQPDALKALYAAARAGKPSKNFAILNARHHEQEAFIVAEAGVPGAITIATNMAGRGTDIQLGGNVEMRVQQELDPAASQEERDAKEAAVRAEVADLKQKAIEAGGLYIVGTERHESRRIDNQLRGRSGRQGDPGRSKFFLSLQDDLMRIFGSERMDAMLRRLGLKDDEAIVHPWINKALEKAQQKVEARNFDMRKNILKFDNVMNDQRKVIFEDRRKMMAQDSLEPTIAEMRAGVIDDIVAKHIPHDAYPEAWDIAGLKQEVAAKLNLDVPVEAWAKEEGIADEEMAERLHKAADEAYDERVERNSTEAMRYVEKQVILQTLDHLWRDHLVTLDHLRQVIGWRGMAQRDPLNEYKSEAFDLFRQLIAQWHEAVIAQMMRVEVRFQAPEPAPPPMQFQHLDPHTGVNESPFGQIAEPIDGGPFSAVEVSCDARAGAGRCRRARSRQSRDLGQDRPQRALPVRLGQEVQALPRAAGLTTARSRGRRGRGARSVDAARCARSSTSPNAKRRLLLAAAGGSQRGRSDRRARGAARRGRRRA